MTAHPQNRNFGSFFAFRYSFFLKRKTFSGSFPVFSANASGLSAGSSVMSFSFCKRYIPLSESAFNRQGSFAPQALPRFTTTASPPDFPQTKGAVHSPTPSLSYDLRFAGSPKFRVKLSPRAVRYHPGEPDMCFYLPLPCPYWFHHSWKIDHSHLSFPPGRIRKGGNEAESGSLSITARNFVPQNSDRFVTSTAVCFATCLTDYLHDKHLSVC